LNIATTNPKPQHSPRNTLAKEQNMATTIPTPPPSAAKTEKALRTLLPYYEDEYGTYNPEGPFDRLAHRCEEESDSDADKPESGNKGILQEAHHPVGQGFVDTTCEPRRAREVPW
jgi:hypothetical protein